jgi:hypothetical protein
MTQQELRNEIWDSLPPVRRRVVGRERVDDLITMSIENYPIHLCQHIQSESPEGEVVLAVWSQSVKRGYCLIYGEDKTFGPLFWILIGPIVQIILKKLLDYWFSSGAGRVLLSGWKRDLTR